MASILNTIKTPFDVGKQLGTVITPKSNINNPFQPGQGGSWVDPATGKGYEVTPSGTIKQIIPSTPTFRGGGGGGFTSGGGEVGGGGRTNESPGGGVSTPTLPTSPNPFRPTPSYGGGGASAGQGGNTSISVSPSGTITIGNEKYTGNIYVPQLGQTANEYSNRIRSEAIARGDIPSGEGNLYSFRGNLSKEGQPATGTTIKETIYTKETGSFVDSQGRTIPTFEYRVKTSDGVDRLANQEEVNYLRENTGVLEATGYSKQTYEKYKPLIKTWDFIETRGTTGISKVNDIIKDVDIIVPKVVKQYFGYEKTDSFIMEELSPHVRIVKLKEEFGMGIKNLSDYATKNQITSLIYGAEGLKLANDLIPVTPTDFAQYYLFGKALKYARPLVYAGSVALGINTLSNAQTPEEQIKGIALVSFPALDYSLGKILAKPKLNPEEALTTFDSRVVITKEPSVFGVDVNAITTIADKKLGQYSFGLSKDVGEESLNVAKILTAKSLGNGEREILTSEAIGGGSKLGSARATTNFGGTFRYSSEAGKGVMGSSLVSDVEKTMFQIGSDIKPTIEKIPFADYIRVKDIFGNIDIKTNVYGQDIVGALSETGQENILKFVGTTKKPTKVLINTGFAYRIPKSDLNIVGTVEFIQAKEKGFIIRDVSKGLLGSSKADTEGLLFEKSQTLMQPRKPMKLTLEQQGAITDKLLEQLSGIRAVSQKQISTDVLNQVTEPQIIRKAFASTFKQQTATATIPFQSERSIFGTTTIPMERTNFAQRDLQITKAVLETGQVERQILKESLSQIQPQKQIQRQQLQQREMLKEKEMFRDITTTMIPFESIRTRTRPILTKTKKKKTYGFAGVTAYSGFIKKRGVITPIFSGLPRGLALKRLNTGLRTSLSRTGYVKPSGETNIEDISYNLDDKIFRGYTQKKGVRTPLPFLGGIKRTKYSFSTPEEKYLIKASRRRLKF